jgi:hypothetical protein
MTRGPVIGNVISPFSLMSFESEIDIFVPEANARIRLSFSKNII